LVNLSVSVGLDETPSRLDETRRAVVCEREAEERARRVEDLRHVLLRRR